MKQHLTTLTTCLLLCTHAFAAAEHPEIVKELLALGEKMTAEIGGNNPTARRPAGKVENPVMLYPSSGREKKPKEKSK